MNLNPEQQDPFYNEQSYRFMSNGKMCKHDFETPRFYIQDHTAWDRLNPFDGSNDDEAFSQHSRIVDVDVTSESQMEMEGLGVLGFITLAGVVNVFSVHPI